MNTYNDNNNDYKNTNNSLDKVIELLKTKLKYIKRDIAIDRILLIMMAIAVGVLCHSAMNNIASLILSFSFEKSSVVMIDFAIFVLDIWLSYLKFKDIESSKIELEKCEKDIKEFERLKEEHKNLAKLIINTPQIDNKENDNKKFSYQFYGNNLNNVEKNTNEIKKKKLKK